MIEKLVEVYEVIEYRDGAIFKTLRRGRKWVEIDARPPSGVLYVPLSTEDEKRMMDNNEPTMRAKLASND